MNKNFKKNLEKYLITGGIFLIVFIVILIRINLPEGENDLRNLICDSNEDCTITTYEFEKCCGGCKEYPINKEHYQKQIKWQEDNCDQNECPLFNCYSEEIAIPVCKNNLCEIGGLPEILGE